MVNDRVQQRGLFPAPKKWWKWLTKAKLIDMLPSLVRDSLFFVVTCGREMPHYYCFQLSSQQIRELAGLPPSLV